MSPKSESRRRRIVPVGVLSCSLVAALPAFAQDSTTGVAPRSPDLPPPPESLLADRPGHPDTPVGGRWSRYGNAIAEQIQVALRANKKTRDTAVQVHAQVWFDLSGRVSRVQLVAPSGNAGLDATLRNEILAGLALREPPTKDMPMPVVVHVTPQPAGRGQKP